MIIAAAIKYKIDSTGEEVILCGVRHGDILTQLKALGFQPRKGYEEVAQGFVDNLSNFLTREEAYRHAKNCGQLSQAILAQHRALGYEDEELFSEDLW